MTLSGHLKSLFAAKVSFYSGMTLLVFILEDEKANYFLQISSGFAADILGTGGILTLCAGNNNVKTPDDQIHST